MVTRRFGDAEVWAAVEQPPGGALVAVIMVRMGNGQIRRFPMEGFTYRNEAEASENARRALDDVTGVSADGTLRYR